MPRKQLKPPSYGLHKSSGLAVVRLAGKDRYLGRHGSPESYERYERAIAEWRLGLSASHECSVPASALQGGSLSINELLLRYMQHAEAYYVDSNGHPTHELQDMRYALRPIRRLYGRTPVVHFGPRALKAVRQHMVETENLSRKVVNHRINRIRRVFKWAVSEELAPAAVFESLRAVDGLKFGRTTARETEPVKPVPMSDVTPIADVLSSQVSAMVKLQLLCAMRRNEVVKMRPRDIDQRDDIWIYEPPQHKNRWREHKRQIFIGYRAQELIKPFLNRGVDDYLFSPIEAEQWRLQLRRSQRQTPITPSQARRWPKPNPGRAKRDCYDTDSYRRAVTYAIQRVNRDEKRQGCPTYRIGSRCNCDMPARRKFGASTACKKRKFFWATGAWMPPRCMPNLASKSACKSLVRSGSSPA